jgi:hypothetical protein
VRHGLKFPAQPTEEILMSRIIVLLLFLTTLCPAAEPIRSVESVLPALAYGPTCWSSLNLNNLGDRVVIVDVDAHRASGALVPLVGHPSVVFNLEPGQQISARLEIQEETGDAWVKVREQIPSQRFSPVVAVSGTSECAIDNQLRTTAREVAYPTRNPWFSGDVSEIPGNIISLVNTSERAARAALCYGSSNLYSMPGKTLSPICSQAFEVQIPPFGARQFPVTRDGNSNFSLKTEGAAIVLQMLRPLATGVKIYSVDSTIKFQQ